MVIRRVVSARTLQTEGLGKRRLDEDEEWGTPASDLSWFPPSQTGLSLECFDTDKRILMGRLYLPDGQVMEYVDEPPAFGYGRYLEEAGYGSDESE